ncbi:MAG: hypothetical protein ABL958_04480 [Bdellovibrionia bacterium]
MSFKAMLLTLALALLPAFSMADTSAGALVLRSSNLKTLFKVRNIVTQVAPEAKFLYFRKLRTLVFVVDAKSLNAVVCTARAIPAVVAIDAGTVDQDCR